MNIHPAAINTMALLKMSIDETRGTKSGCISTDKLDVDRLLGFRRYAREEIFVERTRCYNEVLWCFVGDLAEIVGLANFRARGKSGWEIPRRQRGLSQAQDTRTAGVFRRNEDPKQPKREKEGRRVGQKSFEDARAGNKLDVDRLLGFRRYAREEIFVERTRCYNEVLWCFVGDLAEIVGLANFRARGKSGWEIPRRQRGLSQAQDTRTAGVFRRNEDPKQPKGAKLREWAQRAYSSEGE
ncbi:hypothetical protein B0H12DRAFT_1069004 [Mycena haematopus]|nr:hypothetical protein B0H12DRAFT_1069004 [Mycena haematopus]